MTVSIRVVAPIAVSVALVAFGPATRGVRYLHLPLAAWLVVSAAVLPATVGGRVVVALTGAALGVAAIPGGRVSGRHDGGWSRVIDDLRPAASTRT